MASLELATALTPPTAPRVAYETLLCTSASMGGRGGCRIIDGLCAILDFFSDTRFQFLWEIVTVARVAFETFLCTSASMGGRGGWRITDGQNKSRFVFVGHSGFFF